MIIKKPRTSGKIKSHYGINDYFKFFKKDSEISIDKSTYSNIISDFNEELRDLIIEDNFEYILPYLGASLSIKKDKRVPKIVNGKLYNPTPVDWVATNKLWSEDDESREKKLLVRYNNNHTSKYVFRIYFKKHIHPFINKKFYNFESGRKFQRLLSARIKDETKDRYDTFLLY
jgi:hypothetical protein